MAQKLDITILDLLESSIRNIKAHPLNLGGVSGQGGGAGGPPGGFIGWLPQTRVAYDEDEIAWSGTSISGSLLDNLNHIRARLKTVESGGALTVINDMNTDIFNPVDTIHFSGGVVITDLGEGDIRVTVTGGGSGGGAGIWGAITGTLSDQTDLQNALDLKADKAGTLAQFAATTSLQLKTLISDETGSGALVFADSPVFTAPNLGTPSALVLTNATGTPTSIGLANGTGLPLTTGVTGILPAANGGTGVNNSTRTLTINTNGGTLSFTNASSTVTFPETGTVALLGTANVFTNTNQFTAIGVGIAPNSTFFAVNVEKTSTATSSISVYSGYFVHKANPASASSSLFKGLYVSSETAGAMAQNITGSLTGIVASVSHGGSGTVSDMKGLSIALSKPGSGVATTGYGAYISIADTFGTSYGLYVDTGFTEAIHVAGGTTVLQATTVTTINKVSITTPAVSATLQIASGKTLKISNSLDFAGTDSTVFTFPAASDTVAGLGTAQTFTANQQFDGLLGIGIAVDSATNINAQKTFTDTSGTIFGINSALFANPAGASSATYRGSQATARTTTGNAQNFTGSLTGLVCNMVHQGTATVTLGKGATYQIVVNNTGTITDAIALDVLAHSVTGGGAITNAYGLRIGNITAGGTLNFAISTGTGLVHFGDDVDLASGKNLTIIAASIITDTTTGLKIGTSTTQKLGFFNSTPIVKGTAFTQTYSTASHTHTQTTMTDPAAYGAGANGYSTAAMAQAIHAEVIALKANMVVTQNVLNGLIDDLQALGLIA